MGIRIGHCSPEPTDARALAHWVHPRDLAQLIEVGLTADYHHEIVYGVSSNSASWWDNQRALELGYRPCYSADLYASELAAKVNTEAVAEIYQGGSFAAEGFVGDASRPARAA